jgi:hypothetical protein
MSAKKYFRLDTLRPIISDAETLQTMFREQFHPDSRKA